MIQKNDGHAESRRMFFKKSAVAGAAIVAASPIILNAVERDAPKALAREPWYRRTLRWGQTNITEADPAHYDVEWWRGYWKRTRVQGVIINAGGIVAYYPSKFPLHYRPKALGDRDLFGELTAAAHADGLIVFARMDSNRAHEDLFRAHPEWFARQKNGDPYRAGEHFITCINSGYYDEYIPQLLREIIERSHPDGFTDNSWAGLGRGSICYCENCQRSFRNKSGQQIPPVKDWDDPTYRTWIEWNYARRLELWEFNNNVTKTAGGPNCIWSGMNSGSISGQSGSFRDFREICRRAEIIMLDHQTRGENSGFQNNTEIGKLIHGILGWDKLVPESMAMYQAGRPTFRLSSKPPLEAQLWMAEGFAGGIQPWWHHVGAYHEDTRMYHTAEALMKWHEKNETYLVNRRPVANVGLVWSQSNTDFYGRDDADQLVEAPWRGWTNALLKARIPYLPIHIDDIGTIDLKTLILSNLAAVSDEQLRRIRSFVQAGGNLVVSGDTSRCNEYGERRQDFGLADILGIHAGNIPPASISSAKRTSFANTAHSYLRLRPELRSRVDGPHVPVKSPVIGDRHPILDGFAETDILPFGGELENMPVDPGAAILATFIPPFPIYPPETAWMRQATSDIPAIIARTLPNGSRIAYFAADIDRRYGRDNLPDHQRLLENAVRWAGNGNFPISVQGPGILDAQLYAQRDRLILHLVNLTSPGMWRAPVEEIMPAGPLRVTIRIEDGAYRHARLLVSGGSVRIQKQAGSLNLIVPRVELHEVVVIER